MKKLKILTTTLLLSISLNATTIYYNGEGNDIGEWSIRAGGTTNASLTEVYDNTLNSNVMQFSAGGDYNLRLPNNVFWTNETEHVLSFDMRLNSYYTIYVYVNTLDGVRKLFYNALNVHVGHHNTGILNAIGNGRTHMFQRSGWREANGAPAFNRNGWVRATLDLDRELTDTEPNNRVISIESLRIGGSAGRIDNVTLDNPARVTHSANANDWHITQGIPEGGVIENHQENEDRGNVISFSGTNVSNSYTSGATNGADAWNDTTHDIIQWKMRSLLNSRFVVHTQTANGLRDLVYTPTRTDAGLNVATGEIGIGVGWSRNGDGTAYGLGTDNRWQTFTRNIATDLLEFDNGNSLTSINGVTVMGINGREFTNTMMGSTILIDDVQLFSSVVPTETPVEIHQEATNLHRWRLRMNSVRISFTDNSNEEIGFRFINADTEEQLGTDMNPLANTGASGIGQINNLTPNTTYNIIVQTILANGESVNSEPITITTLEDPNAGEGGDNGDENNAQSATDLHRWRLRENSVRISFIDHANNETGFRFINADTNEQLGNNLNAVDGTGNSTIGQINGLNAGTTYNIRVQTLLPNGETALSNPITITTLGEANNGGENNAQPATDLHRWRLRSNSVRISFRDNANNETGFRFINADTNTQMGNNINASEGTGSSLIGQINNLTPNTTYTILVQTLLENGDSINSQPITITTLEQ